jgi:hypothetical protein
LLLLGFCRGQWLGRSWLDTDRGTRNGASRLKEARPRQPLRDGVACLLKTAFRAANGSFKAMDMSGVNSDIRSGVGGGALGTPESLLMTRALEAKRLDCMGTAPLGDRVKLGARMLHVPFVPTAVRGLASLEERGQ